MTATPNKNYTLPTVGSDFGTWGTELNVNFTAIDSNIGGVASVSVAGNSNVTASPAQAANLIQVLTGVLTGNIEYILPPTGGFYIIANTTTGAFTLTVACAGGGTTIAVPQGFTMLVFTDGVNVLSATNVYAQQNAAVEFSQVTSTGVIAATGAGTGLTVTNNATVGGVTSFGSSGTFFADPTVSGQATLGFATGNFLRLVAGTGFVLESSGSVGIVAPSGVGITGSGTITGSLTVDGNTLFGTSGQFEIIPNNSGSQYLGFATGNYIQYTPGTGFQFVTAGDIALVAPGGVTIGGVAVVVNSGTYTINITGSAASATNATNAVNATNATNATNAGTASALVSGTNVTLGTATANGVITAQAGITINGGGGVVLGSSGWQMSPTGTGAFSSTVAPVLYCPGGTVLAANYYAASDARLKPDKRPISPEEGMRFVQKCFGMLYRKYGQWEAGFLAQDAHAAGFNEILVQIQDDEMPAEQNGSSGPEGIVWQMQENGAQAYLAAALRGALEAIDRLTARLDVLEARL